MTSIISTTPSESLPALQLEGEKKKRSSSKKAALSSLNEAAQSRARAIANTTEVSPATSTTPSTTKKGKGKKKGAQNKASEAAQHIVDPFADEPIDQSITQHYARWFLADHAAEHNQPTLNIGTLGHVAHGKSSITRALSGIKTQRFGIEQRKNLTIKLGYANFKIYKCTNPMCPPPLCYASWGSKQVPHPPCSRPACGSAMNLVRHVSIVDSPGHEHLMATMLNGAAVMDAALMVIAANESVPQPQTAEHLVAAEILGLENLIVLQNKMDLINREKAYEHLSAIRNFLDGSVAEDSPIIPVCAAPTRTCNIDVLLQYIVEKIPMPIRDLASAPMMQVVRSFDVNKPGGAWEHMKGGVAGGSAIRGVLRVGQEVELRPGLIKVDISTGSIICSPLFTKVVSLFSEHNTLSCAQPGGLIGVGTNLDPTLTRGDRLVGQVLGAVDTLPDVFLEVDVTFSLMKRVLGMSPAADETKSKVRKLTKGEVILASIGASSAAATVSHANGNSRARLLLKKPICVEIGQKMALSRRFPGGNWRLVGYGTIVGGMPLPLDMSLRATR